MTHLEAFKLVAMPPAIARLPKDSRGFPIPATAKIKADGKPDFASIDMEKWVRAVRLRSCGICGRMMHGRVWFIGGPMCVENRLFFDHPMHEDCAKYALQVCPFLALPSMRYRKEKNYAPEDLVLAMASNERPDRFMLGKTKQYIPYALNDEPLLRAWPWEELTWWKDGKEIPA